MAAWKFNDLRLGSLLALIKPVLERAIRSKQRVLLCFDFAYSYPVDFAPALQLDNKMT
jgi:hypothetical protein